MKETQDLARQLVELQEAFNWATKAETFQFIDTWQRDRSGSVFNRYYGRPAGPDLVVKMAAGWTSEVAQQTFDAMTILADVIGATSTVAAAIRPLAWSDTPPTVVMPYIDGVDVVSILRKPDHLAWAADVDDWMHTAGAMLADYHALHLASQFAPAAATEVGGLAHRFRIGRSFGKVDWDGRVAGAYGDYGPGNLYASSDGNLYLLDPPVDPHPAPIHRDLGNFVFELRRQLAGRGFTPSPPVPGQFERLCDAFMIGYSDAWDSVLDETDRSLVALYELRRAAGMARKRFPSRPGDALWFARAALERRRVARAGRS